MNQFIRGKAFEAKDKVFCCHKLSQIYSPKTTQIYHLTVLKVRSPKCTHWAKIKVLAGCVPSGGTRGESVPFLTSRGTIAFSLTRTSTFAPFLSL